MAHIPFFQRSMKCPEHSNGSTTVEHGSVVCAEQKYGWFCPTCDLFVPDTAVYHRHGDHFVHDGCGTTVHILRTGEVCGFVIGPVYNPDAEAFGKQLLAGLFDEEIR